jgi:threonine/homoserine efflux transporter RhtA
MGLDWVAGILELVGLWKVGDRNRAGFAFNIACGLCWVTYVLLSKSTYGLLIVVVPAMAINLRNFIKWGADHGRG